MADSSQGGIRWRMAGPDGGAVDECALIAQVAARDMDAFEALYRRYQARLQRFVHRVVRRPALADEVVDDSMLVVWSKAGGYDGSCKPSTWIFAIAYRQALKALRRVDDAVEFANEPEADPSLYGPDAVVQQQELQARIRRALDALSVEQRAVIELTYYQGYSCAETARIVDCPVDTVKTRMFHARRRLKPLLEPGREEAG
jgi:RNA polymerase sigma-70 factor (ECF subfamily)